MQDYDILVAGAGTAGSSVAEYLARKGFSVALLDRRQKERIGDKPCGDAIDSRHFKLTGFEAPSSSDTVNRVKGIRLVPPSLNTQYLLTSKYGDGYVVDRHRDGQTRVDRAIAAGAVLYDHCLVKHPLMKEHYVEGVRAVRLNGDVTKTSEKQEIDLTATVTVDATGWQAVLYRQTPADWGMDKEMGPGERIDSSRDIVEIRDPDANNRLPINEDYLDIILTRRYAPGCYVWRFPASPDGRIINVGNGVAIRPGAPKSRSLLEEYYRFDETFQGSRRLKSATWPIPVRSPRGRLVGNGFVAIGDAAIQIDPTTAEGIGYGLGAAWYLGETIREILEAGERPEEANLWRYAHRYMTSPDYGLRQAKFNVFRLFLQNGKDEEFNAAMKHSLIKQEDLQGSIEGEIRIGLLDKLRRGVVSVVTGQARLLSKLRYVYDAMGDARSIYEQYPPDPGGYPEWKRKETLFLKEVRSKL